MMRHVLIAFLALCLGASPALAAFSVTFKTAALGNIIATETTSAQTITAGHLIVALGGAKSLPNGTTTFSVSDQNVSDVWTTVTCRQTAGGTAASYIAYVITAGLSSQTISVTGGGGNMTAPYIEIDDVTGAAASSVEDSVARGCTDNGGSATTTPTQTSGVPSGSGELFMSSYTAPQTDVAFSFTEDAAWTKTHALGGSTNITFQGSYVVNAGSSAETRAPTTTSATYSMPIMAFCPSGGCSAPAAGTNQGIMMRGVQ